MTKAAFVLLGAGAIACVLQLWIEPRRLLFAWLSSFGAFFSLATGALFVVFIIHAARVRWFVPLRRIAELPLLAFPLLILLLVPILAGMETLYPWAGALEEFGPAERELLAQKAAWLNPLFFVLRSLLWIGLLTGFALSVFGGSLRQDREAADSPRLRWISTAGIPIGALVLTFASFDWMMSLDPLWYSTIYGLYVFSGGFLGALALVGLVSIGLERRALLPSEVGVEHRYALGRLLLAFVIFWGYIAFAQLLLIWIADLPREISFYALRIEGGWSVVSWALGLLHFALPLALLLSRELKRRRGPLSAVCVLLLFVHLLDHHWLVMPHAGGAVFHPLDLGPPLLMSGLFLLLMPLALRGRALMPIGDPRLPIGLRYRGS